MRVAIISVFDISTDNGSTVRAKRVYDILTKHGYDTSIITSSKKDNNIANYKTINVGGLSSKYVSTQNVFKFVIILVWNIKLFFTILRYNFDLIYCSNNWSGFAALYLIQKLNKKCKVLFEAHSIISQDIFNYGCSKVIEFFLRLWEIFVAHNCNCFVALSENTFEYFRQYNKNIILATVFVDEDLFSPSLEIIENDNYKVGIIGPFDNRRGVTALNYLFKNIDLFDDKIKFICIGSYKNKIEHNKIEYTGYLESTHEYILELRKLKAVLNLEQIATTGPLNKIIEPMACGIPVITVPQGVVGLHNFKVGKDIIVCQIDDVLNTINQVIFDEVKLRSLAKNGRRYVIDNFSKKKNESEICRAIQICIKGSN